MSTPKETKLGCRINGAHDARAHVVEPRYDAHFTRWHGVLDVSPLAAATGLDVPSLPLVSLLDFEDGRSGHVFIMHWQCQIPLPGLSAEPATTSHLLYFVGVERLAVRQPADAASPVNA